MNLEKLYYIFWTDFLVIEFLTVSKINSSLVKLEELNRRIIFIIKPTLKSFEFLYRILLFQIEKEIYKENEINNNTTKLKHLIDENIRLSNLINDSFINIKKAGE